MSSKMNVDLDYTGLIEFDPACPLSQLFLRNWAQIEKWSRGDVYNYAAADFMNSQVAMLNSKAGQNISGLTIKPLEKDQSIIRATYTMPEYRETGMMTQLIKAAVQDYVGSSKTRIISYVRVYENGDLNYPGKRAFENAGFFEIARPRKGILGTDNDRHLYDSSTTDGTFKMAIMAMDARPPCEGSDSISCRKLNP